MTTRPKARNKARCDWCRGWFADTRITLPRAVADIQMCSYACCQQYWEEERFNALIDEE